MKANKICTLAAEMVKGDRHHTHGDIYESHTRIALLWSAYLNEKLKERLSTEEVSIMLALMKIARTKSGNFNIDDYIDLAGYAGCAGEVASMKNTENEKS